MNWKWVMIDCFAANVAAAEHPSAAAKTVTFKACPVLFFGYTSVKRIDV